MMPRKPKDKQVQRKIIGLYTDEWMEIDAHVQKKGLKGRPGWIRKHLKKK